MKEHDALNISVGIIVRCRDYIEKSYSGTPGRFEILEQIRIFEELLTEFYSKEGDIHV